MVDVADGENLEFKWGKKRGIGGKKKDVQFYESFTYDGVEYTLYDCVYLYKEGESEPYIGKLIKIWENADKTKKVKVLWFFRPCEISNFLSNYSAAENELFLACGEGVGLANINPLEAIAGKCNVVCLSKDSRNPQPSNEDVRLSDFIFYRTFDVGRRKILDKIDEKIAGIEVKFIFNRVDFQKPSNVLKLDLDKNEVGRKAVASDEKVISIRQNVVEKHITAELEGISTNTLAKEKSNASFVKRKSSLVEKPTSSVDVVQDERAKTKDRPENVSDDKSNSGSEVKENAVLKAPFVKQKSSLGEKVISRGGVPSGKMIRTEHKLENVSNDKTTTSSKVEPQIREAKSGKVREAAVEERVNSAKDPGELDIRPSKKPKLVNPLNVDDDRNKNGVQKLGFDFDGSTRKAMVVTMTNEDKYKSKLTLEKDSNGIDKEGFKKPKGNLDSIEPMNNKLIKASSTQTSNVGSKSDNQVREVTRRPTVDRSKWFKELPWEERMRVAHEQGTLVLLENLDPSYTSTEVEDIIWHAFKESCSAKMISRIAFSSPHFGQAYVIFKTREIAEMVVTKLDEGCLLLSNGRPLVGSIRAPCFIGKQPTFFGHLVIDKLKFQMQREMREAVSTSHCSQPNTLEYDMAMEWCLLRERFDCAWRKLYEQQGQELRKLKARLKAMSKPKRL